jgi:hypothetical protein
LLVSIRHVGAFSAVSPVYATICNRLFKSRSGDSDDFIPRRWLMENLDSLLAPSHCVSITRRSAGIPYSILAILASESSSSVTPERVSIDGMTEQFTLARPLMALTMHRLFDAAQQAVDDAAVQENRTDLPQVHAFNILRTLMRDARLAEGVMPWIANGFILAISSFGHPWCVIVLITWIYDSWAIRNCATMLFSALANRMFSTNVNRDERFANSPLTVSAFFTKLPALLPFVRHHLVQAVEMLEQDRKATHAALFPILCILTRLDSAPDCSDYTGSWS